MVRLAAFTGMGGKTLAELLGGPFINEVIAQGRGTHHFCLKPAPSSLWAAKTPR